MADYMPGREVVPEEPRLESQDNISYWEGNTAERVPVAIREGRVNFRCLAERCPTPCCGPFSGLGRGLTPCFVSSFSDIYLLEEDVERLVNAGRADLVVHTPEGYKILLKPDTSCAAFHNGLCTIHSLRPQVCRAFPFDFDLFAGLVMISKCPGVNAGWTEPTEFADAISALRQVYEWWIKNVGDQVSRATKDAAKALLSDEDLPVQDATK